MNLPNYITLFRIVLVPFFFSFLTYYNAEHPFFRPLALTLFLIAVATDALDGLIARSFRKQTELGTFLDPLADKLLLLSGFFGILFSTALTLKPPLWIVIVIVFRDLLIVCGLIIIFLTTNQIRIRPNILGKLTTFFQMLTIVVVLSGWSYAYISWWITVVLTIASCIAYLVRGIKLVNNVPA
ncbi:MAG: CDP-diacylglycerol--glycerol-3-phosphate 3-phosphatidyltransferase [Omnitrophica bacterium RIFCSPHIGHO2_02_FULL_46_11]|nr:MAG: CDP-diacylglycerol--glycerol-3-phosphate 3-phosphatidyltransferase [Omnitrophica bacterium RIFCSPHIGHO2_02_FULL_46_11]OGW86310.1 MAG: CDP-diacylglycerol--glycerol-3-phosphate 3-phosphatidyltransferase [Omnitrophica bacterium RIFCSPLOWO2_01_FULL_45_10b]